MIRPSGPGSSRRRNRGVITKFAIPLVVMLALAGACASADGRGFFTNSEGAMQPIHHTACR